MTSHTKMQVLAYNSDMRVDIGINCLDASPPRGTLVPMSIRTIDSFERCRIYVLCLHHRPLNSE